MKKFLIVFFTILVLINVWVYVTDKTFIYTVLYHNLADIDDYKIFNNRIIHKSKKPQIWIKNNNYNFFPDSIFIQELEDLETIAFLIIKNDSIFFEKYWQEYNEKSVSNSFSMAKTFVSALIGVALQEGKIKNIDQKVSEFLPQFKNGKLNSISLKNLLTMSSGLNWQEEYLNPFSTVSEAYYGNDLNKIIFRLKVIDEPGKVFIYKGGDTQILAFVLEKIYNKTLSEILEEKMWNKLGAEFDALWSLDAKNGREKASCCLFSNAKDYARIGKLYLDSGKINTLQIIPKYFISQSTVANNLIDKDGKNVNYYGYQWWVIPDYKGKKVFYARGVSGQYIIVVPDVKLIIVRLGKKRGPKIGPHLKEVFSMIDQGLKIR